MSETIMHVSWVVMRFLRIHPQEKPTTYECVPSLHGEPKCVDVLESNTIPKTMINDTTLQNPRGAIRWCRTGTTTPLAPDIFTDIFEVCRMFPVNFGREVLTLHIGQCGVNLGSALWEHYCLEHGVNLDGSVDDNMAKTPGFSSFFYETQNGKCHPRAIFVDLEPNVADKVGAGKYKGLYRADQFFSWREDAASIFPRGYYVSGKSLLISVNDRLRLFLESFDSFQGFMLMRSIGGGTGSGYTSLILDSLGDDLGKKPVVDLGVYPTVGSGVTEPYNAILGTDASSEQIGCSVMMDNEAIKGISLGLDKSNLLSSNRLVAQAVSSITASIRFEGSLNMDLVEFHNNLVPYPRTKFPFVSYAPINNEYVKHRESVQTATNACFKPGNRMCSVAAEFGQYLAVCLVYSGDVVQKEVMSAVTHLKELGLASFVDWSPGLKIGISHKVPIFHPELKINHGIELSLGSVANSTAAGHYWSEINHRYDLMFHKAAFLHWFCVEGMEELDFREARETTAAIENEYLQLSQKSQDVGTNRSIGFQYSQAKLKRPSSTRSRRTQFPGNLLTTDSTLDFGF